MTKTQADPVSAYERYSGAPAADASGKVIISANKNKKINIVEAGTSTAEDAGGDSVGSGSVGSRNDVGSGGGSTTTNRGVIAGSRSNSGSYEAAVGLLIDAEVMDLV